MARPNAGEHNKQMMEEWEKGVFDAFVSDADSTRLHLPAISSLPGVIIKPVIMPRKIRLPFLFGTGIAISWPFRVKRKTWQLPFIGRVEVSLPSLRVGAKEDVYIKNNIGIVGGEHHVSFIQKNNKPYCFTWRTTAKNLRQGVRWGIIPVESVTGKVINALGYYRVVAHERVIKGLISNTHRFKIALLDHYQDRFEALQEIESLVNKNNINALPEGSKKTFASYIEKLKKIQASISPDLDDKTAKQLVSDIECDIKRAQAFDHTHGSDYVLDFVKRQMIYNLHEMQGINQDLTYSPDKRFALTRGEMNDCIENSYNVIDDHRADPHNLVTPEHHGNFGSDEEVVVYNFKKDHLTSEREKEVLLGISFVEGWDKVVYNENGKPELHVVNHKSPKQNLNDDKLIEIAKEKAKNLILLVYAEKYNVMLNKGQITQEQYDRIIDTLTEDQYKAELAAFNPPDEKAYRPLSVTATTNWRISKNAETFFKKIGMILWNTIMSVFVRTQSWDENPWPEVNEKTGKYKFRAFAANLRRSSYVRTYEINDPWYIKIIKVFVGKTASYDRNQSWYKNILMVLSGTRNKYTGARPNDPVWQKAFDFFAMLASVPLDLLFGVWEFGKNLFSYLPKDIYYDWKAAQPLPSLVQVISEAESQIAHINDDFVLSFQCYSLDEASKFNSTAKLAQIPYHLTAGEWGDLLNSVVRGVDGFAGFFTEGFAKNPVGAAGFGAAYVFVGGSVLAPQAFSFLGTSFINWAQGFASSLASSKVSSAVAGAALVGQWTMGAVDAIQRGPKSDVVNAIYVLSGNYLSLGIGVAAGWAVGNLLTKIPLLHDDLGSNPDIGKLTFGGKGAVALYEVFHSPEQNPGGHVQLLAELSAENIAAVLSGQQVEIEISGKKMMLRPHKLNEEQRKRFEREMFVAWMARHKKILPKLDEDVRQELARHIDTQFEKEQAAALKKLLFPEREHRMIMQVIKVPGDYPLLAVRWLVSLATSAFTQSSAPLQRASNEIWGKIKKDCARLVFMAEGIVRLLGRLSIIPKVLAFCITLPIARLVSLAGGRPGHAIHQFFAICHVAFRKVGEFLLDLFAKRLFKHVTTEHPVSVLLRESESGTTQALFKNMNIPVSNNTESIRDMDNAKIKESVVVKPNAIAMDEEMVDRLAPIMSM